MSRAWGGAYQTGVDSPPDLPAIPEALATLPGGRAALAGDDGVRVLGLDAARAAFNTRTLLVAHAALTGQRLRIGPVSRSAHLLDVLELFAFVRPARFCASTPTGLALALGLTAPGDVGEQAAVLRGAAIRLLEELARSPTPNREAALAQAETLARAGWSWGPHAIAALRAAPIGRAWRGDGLDAWSRLTEWEDEAQQGDPGSQPIDPEAVQRRLAAVLDRAGLDESRPDQARFAEEAAFAFEPREREDEPRMMLAEAGTGVGKTLAYLAPAAEWADRNKGGVWVSTYTRALQRQIAREARFLWNDGREDHAVVRKGRENYLCLLNFQEAVQAARQGGFDLIGAGLIARWIGASADGDMTGADYPAWLPTLFATSPAQQAGPANLVDRRGECIHAGCQHYRVCFIEKAFRAARHADLVIANHAVVLTQAAFETTRTLEAGEGRAPRRIVFDEGHHLFDAADSAFSAEISGMEAAEMRRWIRGPEGRSRRARGLETRLGELLNEREEAREALMATVRAAAVLPAEGWPSRILMQPGAVDPQGPVEVFLAAVHVQLRARASSQDFGLECAARPALDEVREAARYAQTAIAALEAPLKALSQALADLLDDEAAELAGNERVRLDGVLRGLDRRARMMLPAWRGMLATLAEEAEDDPDFVDWFDADVRFGRVFDVAYRRHWVDPTRPLVETVLKPAHGVLITSATLTDPTLDDPFALAEMRTGAARMPEGPKTLRLASPFDYAEQARALVVTDLARDNPRQVAAAMRELFRAAGGGGLGLFTAIRRLRQVHEAIAGDLAEAGLALYAQHVDPLEVGALIDIFRAEEDSCLLGVDAVRDGVDVPGRALRLLVFDRAPWPRPDILHKARRDQFGGRSYDDSLARARLAQAFGRLIRRADDRGVFVLLDAATPTRLFAGLPEGVTIERVSLVEAIEITAAHVG